MLVKAPGWCLAAMRKTESEELQETMKVHSLQPWTLTDRFDNLFYLPVQPTKYFCKDYSLWLSCSDKKLCLLCKESSLKKILTGNPFWLNIQALNFTATLSDWKNSGSRQEALFFPFPDIKAEVRPLHTAKIKDICAFSCDKKSFLQFQQKKCKKYTCTLKQSVKWLNKYQQSLHLIIINNHHFSK